MLGKQDAALRMLTFLLPGLLYALPAASQDEREWKRALESSGAPAQSAVPRAPVGHRQPTTADIPKDLPKDPAEAESHKRDRELDAKLRICRGC